MRLNELIKGFIYPEEEKAEKTEESTDNSTDADDEEDEAPQGIDPEEAQERFQAMRAAHNALLKAEGDEISSAQEAATSLFVEFKL
ncbi:MAG TPA: RNA polymerase sigma factor RpoD, partial [Dehalococcoidia bacterium]|nr:RNA polymerase sigma factor RpoD [Dehalococcoidia bacterium]